jgi:Polyketide cyclase / dehydrase and lipid transport
MSADMQRACSSQPPLKRPKCVSATVLIEGSAAAVWEAVWAPETARLIDPGLVACAGPVPGTPERAVGEMQYFVSRHSGGRFTAAVHVVRELDEERRAVTQCLRPPHDEVLHLVTPVPGGTRLELTNRWPAHAHRNGEKSTAASAATRLQAMAEGYKAVIEESAAQPMIQ